MLIIRLVLFILLPPHTICLYYNIYFNNFNNNISLIHYLIPILTFCKNGV